MITVGKISINIDLQENNVMPLLHWTLQFIYKIIAMWQYAQGNNKSTFWPLNEYKVVPS